MFAVSPSPLQRVVSVPTRVPPLTFQKTPSDQISCLCPRDIPKKKNELVSNLLRPRETKKGSYDVYASHLASCPPFACFYLDFLLCLVVLKDNFDFWQVSVKAKGLERRDDMFSGNSLFCFLFTDFVGLGGKQVDEF